MKLPAIFENKISFVDAICLNILFRFSTAVVLSEILSTEYWLATSAVLIDCREDRSKNKNCFIDIVIEEPICEIRNFLILTFRPICHIFFVMNLCHIHSLALAVIGGVWTEFHRTVKIKDSAPTSTSNDFEID